MREETRVQAGLFRFTGFAFIGFSFGTVMKFKDVTFLFLLLDIPAVLF